MAAKERNRSQEKPEFTIFKYQLTIIQQVYVCLCIYSLGSRYIRYNVDGQRLNPLQSRYIAATYPLHFSHWIKKTLINGQKRPQMNRSSECHVAPRGGYAPEKLSLNQRNPVGKEEFFAAKERKVRRKRHNGMYSPEWVQHRNNC